MGDRRPRQSGRRAPAPVGVHHVQARPSYARFAYLLLRPLKAFRMFIVVVPVLAVTYALDAWTGIPATRTWLYLSVAGLAVCAALQFVWYYARQLETEIAAQAAQLA